MDLAQNRAAIFIAPHSTPLAGGRAVPLSLLPSRLPGEQAGADRKTSVTCFLLCLA